MIQDMIGGTMRLLGVLAGALLLMYPAAINAQTVWTMPTEYPASAMPGVGLTAFAKHVSDLSAGQLIIKPSFDAASGIK
jgi:TRAP-type C4-dicarboxylate transport system substrate-binding protein